MRGEQHRDAALLGELLQQLEDLRLDGHVERGGRLVRDDELGLRQQRQRDHQPLPLAAGELVRQLVEGRVGGRGICTARSICETAAASSACGARRG